MSGRGAGTELARLESRVMARLTAANAESTQATTLTALRHLSEFAAGPAKRRQLFVRPRVQGDIAAAAHNEWTLMLWAEVSVTLALVCPGAKLRYYLVCPNHYEH